MASVVDICNLALSHLGDRANLSSIDPPEGSAQADHCANFWPIARDEALSSYDWGFASRVAPLARLSTEDHPQWQYAYSRPADFLVARDAMFPDGQVVTLDSNFYFEEGTLDNGTTVLFAQFDSAALRYTRRVSTSAMYPPKLVSALSYLLASYLAGPVVKGRAGVGMAAAMRTQWDKLAGEAMVVDANQRKDSMKFTPAAIKARGYRSDTVTIESGQYRHELPYWAQG